MFALHEAPDVRDVGDPHALANLNHDAARERRAAACAG